jgi:hypothetical protein
MKWTPEQYAEYMARKGQPAPLPAKPSKYHAVMEECDNIKFQSKKEAKYYRELLCRVHAGEVKYFLRQVPFHLIGGVVYRCDFMEVWTNGEIHFVDPKGHITQVFINKRKQVEETYPVRIEVVK